ncbi:hypothetical protein JOC78_003475 [Bacillus ectoiniformans]|uniref:hypothetical protein n=1 Tax=Bacillus ectoiniformans TaxID=1494429 RepID=UPI00195A6AB9|nr:hypothetical protein [Bacillus ectoiniformans]
MHAQWNVTNLRINIARNAQKFVVSVQMHAVKWRVNQPISKVFLRRKEAQRSGMIAVLLLVKALNLIYGELEVEGKVYDLPL